ncbi:MAG: YdeI/OmpD-associated family protein [Pyrinomonadaceae bacterium]
MSEQDNETIEFFETPKQFRAWLSKHHLKRTELWVGFFKKDSGRESITWPESVEEALSFGWIDGLRKSIDSESYKIRFTPRRPNSKWSAVNIKIIEKLIAEDRMSEEGLRLWNLRKEENSATYTYEKTPYELSKEFISVFKKNKEAWNYFENSAPYYRKVAIGWIMSAKREDTRLRRLNILIEASSEKRKYGKW